MAALSTHARRFAAAVVCCAATAAVVAVPPAAAFGDVVPLYAHFYNPPTTTPGTIACPPRAGAVLAQSIAGGSDKGTERGDTLQGTTSYEVCFWVFADGTMQSDGTETFTGRVRGCGRGSIAWRTTGSFAAPDPATGTVNGHGTFSVIRGSGTGDLRRITRGSGVWSAQATSTLESTGTMLGAASCG